MDDFQVCVGETHSAEKLAITTDFRDIFAELQTKQLGVSSMKSVFPGYEPKPRGVMS